MLLPQFEETWVMYSSFFLRGRKVEIQLDFCAFSCWCNSSNSESGLSLLKQVNALDCKRKSGKCWCHLPFWYPHRLVSHTVSQGRICKHLASLSMPTGTAVLSVNNTWPAGWVYPVCVGAHTVLPCSFYGMQTFNQILYEQVNPAMCPWCMHFLLDSFPKSLYFCWNLCSNRWFKAMKAPY